MKSFFKRLSTKRDRQKESNIHKSPKKPSWPSISSNSLPASVDRSLSNPTFSEVQHDSSQAGQQRLNSTVQQDHDQVEATSFSNDCFDTSELDRQAATSPPAPVKLQGTENAPAIAEQPFTDVSPRNKNSAFRSSRNLPSSLSPLDVPQTSTNSSKHEPVSIYKSYNDFDIMASGTFDFNQNHLLSSAPDADWLSVDGDRVQNTFTDRPKTAREAQNERFSQHWEVKPSGHSSQTLKSKRSIPRSPAPEEAARARTRPFNGPSPVNSGMLDTAQASSQSPVVNQPMVTPFAKYSTTALSGPLLSEDMDTAMRPARQFSGCSQHDVPDDGMRTGRSHNLLQSRDTFCLKSKDALLFYYSQQLAAWVARSCANQSTLNLL